jgi:hypothetical protein
VVHLALALAGPILNLDTGGRWIAACLGLACLHELFRRFGHPGGLSDPAPDARPLWLVALALGPLVLTGPFA